KTNPQKPWVRCAFSDMNLPASPAEAQVTPLKRSRSASTSSKVPRNRSAFSTPGGDLVDLTLPEEGEKVDKTPIAATAPAPPIGNNWMEAFAPASSEDLAVHPKKIGEVRDWLLHCEAVRRKFPAQMCLLTGPTGAGKTATLQVLAREMGYQLQEWINPVDSEVVTGLGDQPSHQVFTASHSEAFRSFLLRASRYKSLLVPQQKRLLLVEDFPNIFLGDGDGNFSELLDDYSVYGKCPLVFVVADSRSRGLNISYRLFPEQLKERLRIQQISFNAVAATIMQKSMKAFCAVMQQPQNKASYKVPSATVLDSIVVGAQGDIRNALINLHLSSLQGVPSMPTKQLNVSIVAPAKGRKKKTQSTLKSIGRDESITLMHALGRVLNPKFDERKRLQHSPEDITEAFNTEPRNFINFVHANFLPHFRDIEHVTAAAHDLALADCMLNEYRDDHLSLLGLNLAIRGSMLANREPVTGWMPVRGPKKIGTQAEASLAEQRLLGVGFAGISRSLYATEYGSLVKSIAGRMPEAQDTQINEVIEDF
ncbi:hypothetical protein KR018_011803, partial [Drosophila ironensis]